MVHKQYIKVGGKSFGPYYYKTYREKGKVKRVYLGKVKEKKVNNKLVFGLVFLALILFFVLFLKFNPVITGFTIFLDKEEFNINEKISGNLQLILQEGELLPADTIININFDNKTKQLTLEELIEISDFDLEKDEGDFM